MELVNILKNNVISSEIINEIVSNFRSNTHTKNVFLKIGFEKLIKIIRKSNNVRKVYTIISVIDINKFADLCNSTESEKISNYINSLEISDFEKLFDMLNPDVIAYLVNHISPENINKVIKNNITSQISTIVSKIGVYSCIYYINRREDDEMTKRINQLNFEKKIKVQSIAVVPGELIPLNDVKKTMDVRFINEELFIIRSLLKQYKCKIISERVFYILLTT